MEPTKRDQLIETALTLFARDGFHATGIDRILSEAGVAKMTLYNHFRSKEELILAALRRRDERFRNWFMKNVDRRAATPREKLLVVFDVLEEWFRQGDFCGCLFINASAEYSGQADAIHGSCAEHKRLFLDYLRRLAADAGAADPDRLARSLNLLAEGATVCAHILGTPDAARDARAAASILIRDALGENTGT